MSASYINLTGITIITYIIIIVNKTILIIPIISSISSSSPSLNIILLTHNVKVLHACAEDPRRPRHQDDPCNQEPSAEDLDELAALAQQADREHHHKDGRGEEDGRRVTWQRECVTRFSNIKRNIRKCGSLEVSVPASRPPVPGSNLGPGPLHSVVWGAADHTEL